MNSSDAVILMMLYVFFSMAILYSVVISIKKQKKITIRCFFELYYLLVYGIIPIVSLTSFLSDSNTHEFFYTTDSAYFYLLFFITVLFYTIYKVSTIFVGGRQETNNSNIPSSAKKRKYIDVSSNKFFFVVILLTVIGLVSLFLWTKAFGNPWDIIKYANVVRSGRSPIQNNFTFMKPFCSFIIIAFYCNLIILKKTKYRRLNFILLLINLSFSIIFLLANDSRMFILVFFLCIVLYYKNKDIKIRISTLISYTCLALIVLFALGKLDSLTYFIRHGEEQRVEESSSAVAGGLSEFGFTYRNGVNVLYFYDNDMLPEMHELKDIKNILTVWLPERFKPDREYLGDLNTSYYHGATGGIPTDIITASIYKFHMLGLVLLPIFMAVFLEAIERFFKTYKSEYITLIYNLVGCNTCLRLIAYYDLSNNISSSFYIIIPTVLFCLFCSSKKEEALNE